MGAYSPAPLLTEDYLDRIIKEIIEPTINELNKKNIDYKGVIYFGLMITKSGPKVIAVSYTHLTLPTSPKV